MQTSLTSYLKNPKVLIALVFGFLAIITLIFFALRTATVTITAPEGSAILISTDKDEDLRQIGTTKATYRTKDIPTNLYIAIEKDGQKTLSGVEITEKKNYFATLSLNPQTKDAQVLTNGSVSSPFIEGTRIQGISLRYKLTNFRTDAFETQKSAFIGLPYMKKIIWKDANNFVYVTFAGKVGRFINNNDLGTEYSIQAKPLPDAVENIAALSDAVKTPDGRIFAVSSNYLVVSSDFGATFNPVAKIESLSDTPVIFADNSNIYIVDESPPSAYASERIRKNQTGEDEHGGTLFRYNFSGKLQDKGRVEGAPLGVVKGGNKPVLATNEGLSDNNGLIPLYLNNVTDGEVIGKSGYVLADNGLWKLGSDSRSLQLVYDISKYGVGLEQSLSTYQNNILIGTTPGINDQKDASAMLVINP